MCCVRLLLTFVLVCTGVTSVKIKIVKPEWPLHYKVNLYNIRKTFFLVLFNKILFFILFSKIAMQTCVRQQTEREFITVGWYVDTEGQRMRLDSYGIPKGFVIFYIRAIFREKNNLIQSHSLKSPSPSFIIYRKHETHEMNNSSYFLLSLKIHPFIHLSQKTSTLTRVDINRALNMRVNR